MYRIVVLREPVKMLYFRVHKFKNLVYSATVAQWRLTQNSGRTHFHSFNLTIWVYLVVVYENYFYICTCTLLHVLSPCNLLFWQPRRKRKASGHKVRTHTSSLSHSLSFNLLVSRFTQDVSLPNLRFERLNIERRAQMKCAISCVRVILHVLHFLSIRPEIRKVCLIFVNKRPPLKFRLLPNIKISLWSNRLIDP